MTNRPATVQTIAGAKRDGTLPPMDRVRLRAQLGMTDEITAANIRRATALLLQRVQDYYTVVQYTGPGYVYGRIDSSYPSALYAAPTHNYTDNSWFFQEMTPAHPTCTVHRLFEEAGSLCIDTACKMAVHELAYEVPEAMDLLGQARYAINSMCESRELAEVYWQDARRRLKTPGVTKVLKRLAGKLSTVQIGKGPVRPVILSPDMVFTSQRRNDIQDWSLPESTFQQAC